MLLPTNIRTRYPFVLHRHVLTTPITALTLSTLYGQPHVVCAQHQEHVIMFIAAYYRSAAAQKAYTHPVLSNDHSTTYHDTEMAQSSTIAPDNMRVSHLPTSYIEVSQLQLQSVVGDHAHGWHTSHPQGFDRVQSSSHTMPNMPYTNGGISLSSGYETQFVSDPQLSVSHPGYWSVNGGYYIAPSHGGQYNSPFTVSPHPMVSQIPTVRHAVADVRASFSPSIPTPTSEVNSLPVAFGMVSAAGQDEDADKITPSTLPYPTGIPLFPSTLGGAPSATPPPNMEPVPGATLPPLVRCMIDNCDQDIVVDKAVLREHLTTTHNYPAPHRSRSVLCRWSGCICTRPSTCRSPNLGADHGVHIEDITDHVWSTHLSFQDVCGKCGDARWARGYSFLRHTNGCAGRKPARCVGCCQLFTSTAALVGHVELGQCVGAVVR
jgi:hypothetical protein